jgi:cell division protein FtsN
VNAAAPATQSTPAEEPADPTAPVTPPGEAPPGPTKTPGLDFQNRLEASGTPSESLVTRPAAPAAKAPAREPVAPATATPPAPVAAAAPATPTAPPAPEISKTYPEPRGDGFAIQVAALTGRSEAEAVAARLKSKGYAVYLVSALPGQPAGFKVRVGKFKARGEAEKIATRLEREEQFKPWITR